MNNRDTMQLVLCTLLLISGLLRLLRRTLCRTQESAALPVTVLLAGGGLLSAAFCAVITHFAGPGMLLPSVLLLSAALAVWAAADSLALLKERSVLVAALLIALWLTALAGVTLLLRQRGETEVFLRFDMLSDISRRGSLEPLTDVLMNLAIFLPLGLLLPWADRQPLGWLNVLSTALLLTASIEALQLLFSLGQADVEDLAANVIGALAGLGIRRLLTAGSSSR